MPEDSNEQNERIDDPGRRIRERLQRLGVPSFNWAGVLDRALLHASDPARADVPPVGALRWVLMGPRNLGGRIGALAQDAREPATIYAGSGIGGLWKTVNAGDTWVSLDDFRPPNPPNNVRQALPIGAIAIAPANRQVLYVGTGEPTLAIDATTGNVNDADISGTGLYRSTNGGTTFEMIDRVIPGPVGSPPSVIAARRFERILVDPWEPRRLWVASPKGLWRGEPQAPAGAPPAFTQDAVTGTGVPAAANQDASDIVIEFGGRSAARDFDPTTDLPPAQFTVYVALRSVGIFRRTFDRAAAAYIGAWVKLDDGLDETNFHRIKLALCATKPNFLYAIFGLRDQTSSRVYRSHDRGDNWTKTAARSDDEDDDQAFFDLVLETHPENPEIVFSGTVDLFRSVNAGDSWSKVIDWENFDKGDRAQHGDQHAFLFDGLDPRKIWAANDGGISISRDLGETWRKRSYGIITAEFYDITVHQVFPYIMGGGLQDMGTWVSFGGPTWYHINGGDGGAMGFDPTNPQRFFTTWQRGVTRCLITSSTVAIGSSGLPDYLTLLPDVPQVPSPPAPTPFTKLQSSMTELTTVFQPGHDGTFAGLLEHHPLLANHALVGRIQGAYVTRNGTTFALLNHPAFNLLTDEVSAITYAPGAPNTDWWIGTSGGELFHTTNGVVAAAAALGTIAWSAIVLPGIVLPAVAPPTAQITDITVHPGNPAIVAVAVAITGGPGRVYLTGDAGVTWQEISGHSAGPIGPPAVAADQLNDISPVLCVAFDPQSPAGVGLAQTLYVGTIAGVYVIRNAIAPVAAGPALPAPVWRTFNNGLPLAIIQDLAVVRHQDALGATRNALRCATLGRGIFECDLAGTPAARLYIRKTPVDDGRNYAAAAVLPTDPRQSPMPALTLNQAFDIRVDAPPFSFFEEVMDGVEFDEDLVHDQPVAGERNLVYVQVHNGGTDTLPGVQVHLFFADAAAAPGGAAWQAVGPPESVTVGPAQPAVARFEWTPPANVPNPVALLACCTIAPQDPIPALPPAVDPANPGPLIGTERRAALRITPVTPFVGDAYIRDGVDDEGSAGSVAWGGRSPDIIVRQAPEATPDVTFSDLADHHLTDKVKGGVTNHIYVRVHNRRGVPLSAEVELYRVPFATMHQGATWVQIGARVAVNDIPPHGSRFAPAFQFANPPDPDPSPYKVYLLVALVIRADDPGPTIATITDQDLFWRFFLRDQIGNNAAMRALRFEPA